ncbi:hypothetical protein LRH25_22075 [Ideonella azotifigens]|uniref:Sulfotransferase family protein n=2 Tax=Ideonella azotifigens TaxID=513160 RepID=A0ABN1KBU6_9BURK|nr:hypothetical protein [Ideonella azotifigens]MCD2343020.1 hypothetical protein [Ideonella azotifigens]
MDAASKPKLFFHIGQTKTGSTSLQAFMHANRDALQWRGLFYPASPPGDRHILKQRFLFDSVDQAAKGSGGAEFVWTRLAEQIVQRDAPINVISEEVFWHLFEDRPQRRRTAVQWMAKQLAHCDVHIVCYLRRQSDWVESWFNQIVKTDVSQTSRLSFEDFIARQERLGVMDYQQMLAVWAEAFGADRVIVRPWERGKLLRGNIVDDFCDLVGLKDMDDLKRPEDQQSSLSATALEAMLSFNRQPTAAAHKLKFTEAFRDELAKGSDKRFLLSAEQAAEIDARYAESNQQVARSFCHTDSLFSPPAEEARQLFSGLTVNELLDVVTRLFVAQQRSMDALSCRLDELESRASSSA